MTAQVCVSLKRDKPPSRAGNRVTNQSAAVRPRTERSEPGQPFRLELLVEFDERGMMARPERGAFGRSWKQMRIEPQQPMHLVKDEAIHPQEILDLLAGARGRPGTIAFAPEGRVVHEVDHSGLPVQLLVVVGPHPIGAELPLRRAEVVGQTQVSAQPGVRQVVGERVSAEVGGGRNVVDEPHENGVVGLDALEIIESPNGGVLGENGVGAEIAGPVQFHSPMGQDEGEDQGLQGSRQVEGQAIVGDRPPDQAGGVFKSLTVQHQLLFQCRV